MLVWIKIEIIIFQFEVDIFSIYLTSDWNSKIITSRMFSEKKNIQSILFDIYISITVNYLGNLISLISIIMLLKLVPIRNY